VKGEVAVAAECFIAEILAAVTEYFTPCEVFDLENEILKNKDPSGWYEKVNVFECSVQYAVCLKRS
jgi:hypothetical protein